jgi:hypothetical protein
MWYRIVTGQVLWWRIRRALNRLLWWRRHGARRALRWIERHPEVKQSLATEGVIPLFVKRLRSRGGPARRWSIAYRPIVTVDADLDITQISGRPLVEHVDIVHHAGAVPTQRLSASAFGGIRITQIASDGEVAADTELLGAVDLGLWNPRWFRRVPTDAPVTLRELPQAHTARQMRFRIDKAQRAAAVVCQDDSSRPAEQTAQAIAELAATGAPLVGPLSSEVACLLDAELCDEICAVDALVLRDHATRELHSVRLRRLAHRSFSPRGTWNRIGVATGCRVDTVPSVSVLLPSNRAADVIDAARQVASQRHVEVQLVVGLHGRHMSHELDDQLADVFPGNLVVRHLPDEMNLGEVLNAITDDIDGELVSKWDDDDWYDGSHLSDLVAALEYSGAAMTAKAAEFVYLETLDLTIRRFVTGSERPSTTVAGGTLLLARSDLERVRWADAPRRVDRLLIDALEAIGRSTYRTHGLGYVLRRRGGDLEQHTWQVNDAYFLSSSHDQRPGLDLGFAGFEPVAS